MTKALKNKITATLILITFIGVFPLDVILPSFPAIGEHFSEPLENISLSLSIFVFGFSIAQLLIGLMSDILGRKRLLLAGLCLAGIGAAGACLSNTFYSFIFFRMLQAIGCGSFVLVNALIQDLYDRSERHTIRVLTTTASGFFISTAPLMGALLQAIGGWRASFGFFIAIALCVITVASSWIPKDLPKKGTRQQQKMGINIKALLGEVFLKNSALSAIGFSSHFAFIVQSPIIFLDELSLSQREFSVLLLLYGLAYIAGGMIAKYINHKVAQKLHVTWGLLTMLCAGLLLSLCHAMFPVSSIGILGPMIICTCGVTILRPAATTAAMDALHDKPGTASSIHNMIIFSIGAAISAMMTLAPLAPVYSLSVTITLLTLAGLTISNWPSQKK
ncbi:MAG: MFS transporter [Janthinobacterium lividum]